jgi:hypothetical protein
MTGPTVPIGRVRRCVHGHVIETLLARRFRLPRGAPLARWAHCVALGRSSHSDHASPHNRSGHAVAKPSQRAPTRAVASSVPLSPLTPRDSGHPADSVVTLVLPVPAVAPVLLVTRGDVSHVSRVSIRAAQWNHGAHRSRQSLRTHPSKCVATLPGVTEVADIAGVTEVAGGALVARGALVQGATLVALVALHHVGPTDPARTLSPQTPLRAQRSQRARPSRRDHGPLAFRPTHQPRSPRAPHREQSGETSGTPRTQPYRGNQKVILHLALESAGYGADVPPCGR